MAAQLENTSGITAQPAVPASVFTRKTPAPNRRHVLHATELLGSLSNNDGDGSENASLKVCSRYFKLKEKEGRCLVFPPSIKREIRKFHVVVVQRRQRNEQKA